VGLIAALGSGRLALDTSVFIYLIEEHPDFRPLIGPLLEQTVRGKRELVTSAVTLFEMLVVPSDAIAVRAGC
jgi:predicted nucleic acid-binding protein